MDKKTKVIEFFKDTGASFLAGLLVAFGLHVFSNANGFAPGGITGIASILSSFFPNISMGYFLIALNIPLFVLESIFVERKLGFILSFYVLVQSVTLILLEDFGCPQYKPEGGNLIFASIATGVVTGFGFSVQIMRHGASGGTYAISALIKKWHPAANIAWLSFAMDSCVVVLVFFLYGFNIQATICTLVNLFIADIVVDKCLQGTKEGYKFEIVTDEPEGLASEIMRELRHGVTELNVQGMYTHTEKFMIVCIIRKRELSKMMRIIKRYPKTFSNFSKVNEVFGNFKK